MVLYKALQQYRQQFVTVLVFLLLGIFVGGFLFFPNFFLSSGTAFLEYQLFPASAFSWALELAAILLFLGFLSVFLSVMIFAVRQDLAKVKFDQYLQEKIPKFSLEMFEFFLVFSIVSFGAGVLLEGIGFPSIIVAFLLLVLSLLLFFVPQSIVIDEVGWVEGIEQSIHFLFKFSGLALFVIAIGLVLVALLPFVELFFDQFQFLGRFVSLFLLLLIVLPFLEILKSVAYLTKYELIKTWM
ncbi:MAG: hypothetical protein V1777_04715 [Candidatus Micrarchaeota archaeon]